MKMLNDYTTLVHDHKEIQLDSEEAALYEFRMRCLKEGMTDEEAFYQLSANGPYDLQDTCAVISHTHDRSVANQLARTAFHALAKELDPYCEVEIEAGNIE